MRGSLLPKNVSMKRHLVCTLIDTKIELLSRILVSLISLQRLRKEKLFLYSTFEIYLDLMHLIHCMKQNLTH